VQSQPDMGQHYCAALFASVANQEEKNNLSVSSWSQTKIMSIQPALWRCFVREGGKLENRQFVAKMHQIASQIIQFSRNNTAGPPHPGDGDTPPQTPSLAGFLQF